ncbi:MAG: TetR family transcriptional regulator [Bacteroidetes bacterium]|jgi:AcrR family transcriptional regulator|nr:TetR family transcriptional regulator [Bacteroidota bacterium]
MATKDRILQAALRQFNQLGTDQTTVRSISEEVGISHGNLCYHYKNTDELIKALYLQLVGRITPHAEGAFQQNLSLEDVWEQSWSTFTLMYEYRFLLLDFARIIRRIDSMRQNFRQLMVLRRHQFQHGIQQLVANGWMLPEPLTGQYDHLITHLLVIGNHWITESTIQSEEEEEEEERIRYYHRAMVSLLFPYLTERGKQSYERLLAEKA